MAPYTLPLREALNDSISSGKFADTKIILFSRRDSSGIVCKPRALYANSHVLRTVPYFNDRKPRPHRGDPANDALRVLFGTFAEAESKDFSERLDDTECAENYGYHSDSDLEGDEDSTSQKALKPARGHPFDPFCFIPTDNEPVSARGEYKERVEKGKVIKIQDVAFITYVFSGPPLGPSDDSTDSRRFYSTSTLVRSSSHPTDQSIIVSRGAPR